MKPDAAKIRHTVVFQFPDSAPEAEVERVVRLLHEAGEFARAECGVTNWVIARHISETFKAGRAHVLQDGIFPSLEALRRYDASVAHQQVLAVARRTGDWMTIDTVV